MTQRRGTLMGAITAAQDRLDELGAELPTDFVGHAVEAAAPHIRAAERERLVAMLRDKSGDLDAHVIRDVIDLIESEDQT